LKISKNKYLIKMDDIRDKLLSIRKSLRKKEKAENPELFAKKEAEKKLREEEEAKRREAAKAARKA